MLEDKPTNRFPPSARLRKRADFQRLLSARSRAYTGHFMVVALPTRSHLETRIGITVTKKIDARAVMRNLIKRRVREWFRIFRVGFYSGIDVVVIARAGAGEIDTTQTWYELDKAAQELDLIKYVEPAR